MNTQIKMNNAKAGVIQPPTASATGKHVPAKQGITKEALRMERNVIAAMRSVDLVIDGLPEGERDPFLREMVKTLEAMQ